MAAAICVCWKAAAVCVAFGVLVGVGVCAKLAPAVRRTAAAVARSATATLAPKVEYQLVSCHRLNMALRVICQDDMGKEAVRDGLKVVKLANVKDLASKKIEFNAGVLEMHCPYAQGASGMFSDGEIRQVLEKGL